jgi:hypothetical protein
MVHAAVAPPARFRNAVLGLLATLALAATFQAAQAALNPTAARAAPPANDAPTAPAGFSSYTAENGHPSDLQATAELQEATADQGVPRCLGPASFARTVWFAVPPTSQPQEITVEASGETLDVLDLAAFVQPPNANPATPQTTQPNVCDGSGSGGAADSQEPTAGVSLRVPAGRAVLIQVGRRGPASPNPNNERAIVSLDDRLVTAPAIPPQGDYADAATPGIDPEAKALVPLFGATLTQDDPAEPPCPALGSIWRKLRPQKKGTPQPRLITVDGNDASTLALFNGPKPTGDNVLDCINRSGRGALKMLVPPAQAKKQLWLSIGTDAPVEESTASVTTRPGAGAYVVDGGPGGFDPTPGGPGGGFPSDCAKADASRASIGGSPFKGNLKRLNKRRRLSIPLKLTRGPICDVQLQLKGPHNRVYATKRIVRIKSGQQFVNLTRPRNTKLTKGSYRLAITALSRTGEHVTVKSTLKARLG